MKSYPRSARVGGVIREILSDILRKGIKDPRLEKVTITGVKVADDLKHARIFFVISDGKTGADRVIQGFKSAMGFIKRTLARELQLRYMPELVFQYDESFDYSDRINSLLKAIASEDHEKDNTPTGTLS